MKKLILSLLVAVLAISIMVLSVSAAPEMATKLGPYNGTFRGYVTGDRGSQAPVLFQLSQNGDLVSGTVSLGEGLYIDGGWCGKGYIPPMTQSGRLLTHPNDPSQIQMKTSVKVSNFDIGVTLNSKMSTDGTINATGSIDLPWICGRDPQLNGTLTKVSK